MDRFVSDWRNRNLDLKNNRGNIMDQIIEKSADASRGLLFGLLVDCFFSGVTNEDCPLQNLRRRFSSIEEKHRFVLGLSDDEVSSILVQHEDCFERKLSNLMTGDLVRENLS